LDPARRLVTRCNVPVRLHSKAFETLHVLIRNSYRVVSKDELIQILWPDTFVEEVNLAQNISALRKALGETPGENRFIATIPGKGYQFVCEVHKIAVAGENPVLDRIDAVLEITGTGAAEPALTPPLSGPSRRFVLSHRRSWIILPLVTVLVLGAAGEYWFERHRAEQAAHSIAVLPFQPLVAGTDDQHLGLGIADAVITRLSNIRQLPVRPTDVAIRYGDIGADPLKAGREMGVDTVLTGRLQRSSDRIRVSVQLVRVSDGRALWAETFDDKYTGIFGVEDSISERVAQALAVNLAAREKLQLQRHYTENLDAYRNYLMGRYEEFTFTPDGMYKAIDDFNRAITEDPGYALAYAGLADAYTTESDWLLPPREALPKADAAARKALAFDDQLAEAHGALAHALLHEWRLSESGREFRTALTLNPSNVSTYFAYSEYLVSTGHADEAIVAMQRALALDPLSPEINSFLAWDYYLKHDYDSCLVSSRKAIQMFPDFWLPHMAAGMCYYIRAQYPDAIREYSRAMVMNPDSTFSQAGIGMSLAKAGKRAEALKAVELLQAMQNHTYVSPAYVSLIYMALGDRDTEFVWLEKSYDDRSEWLLWLPIDPNYDGQRSDPRYKQLMRKVGI
jgi:TolB-like protein/DNA-binding winged helix-turn-helix (wHTH) protein/Tfp pilus assembly protein PilF